LLGFGYWSLTLGFMATSLLTLLGVWLGAGWLPRDAPDFRGVLRFFKFGGAVMLSETASVISREADSVLIGRYIGAAPLGYYDRGNKLAMIPLQRINTVMQSLLLPILSRMAEEGPRYKHAYLRMMRQLMLYFTPGVVAVGATAPVLVPFLLGDQWTPAAPIFMWLTLAALHRPVSMTMNLLFISQGRGRDLLIWSAFSAITSVIAFVIGLRWGVIGVAAAFGLSDILIRLPFLWWLVTRTGPIRMLDLYAAALPFAVASAVTFLALIAMQGLPFPNAFTMLAVSAVAGYALSWGVIALFPAGRATFTDAIQILRKEAPRFVPGLRRG
jgi:PST family polysaccharide transporter